jgi:hypothetical protein
MSIPQRREYKGLYVDFEQLSQEHYCGKVSYEIAVAAKAFPPSTTDYSSARIKNNQREYKTKPYRTPEEVFIDVIGWVDCKLHYLNEHYEIPKDNEDSYKNECKELLKKLEDKRFEEDIKKSQTSKKEREDAYQEGWKNRIEELNNMVVINPE